MLVVGGQCALVPYQGNWKKAFPCFLSFDKTIKKDPNRNPRTTSLQIHQKILVWSFLDFVWYHQYSD